MDQKFADWVERLHPSLERLLAYHPVTGGAWGSHPQLSRGRPIGYKNLDHLMRRLHPIMLRRRKRDVETQLLGRTVTNYLVGMYEEQRLRYDEFNAQAARLVQIAQRRPLT